MKRARKFSVVATPVAIDRTPTTRDEKVAAAIAYLGERYCLHPKFDKTKQRTGFLQRWRINQYNV